MKKKIGKRISALVSMVLVLTMLVSSGSVWAKEKEKRYSDGTLILNKYPIDEKLTAKKENLSQIYSKYKKGMVDKSIADSALKEFFISQGDVASANKIGATDYSQQDLSAKQKKQNQQSITNSVSIASSQESNTIWDLIQQPQEKNYYCGPASAASIIGSKQVTRTQTQLAQRDQLQTERWQSTPWYVDSTTKYVMANVLNSNLNLSYYVAKPSPTLSELQNCVIFNVDYDYGIAESINIGSNDNNIPYFYPQRVPFGHWVAIDGYRDYGDTVSWAEPVYNASSIPWSGNVPGPYVSASMSMMQSMVRARGIIW